MGNLVNLNVSDELIKSALREEVNAGIVRALGDPAQIVRTAIEQMTDLYVDRDGNLCKKNSYYAKPYFDWLVEQTVKDCVKDEITKYVTENKGELANEVRAQLKNANFRNKIAASFVQKIVDTTEKTWKMPISISFEECKEEY